METSPLVAPATDKHNLNVEDDDSEAEEEDSMQYPPSLIAILSNPPRNRAYGADRSLHTSDSDDDLLVTVLINPATISSDANNVPFVSSSTSLSKETSTVHSIRRPLAPHRGSIHVPVSRPMSRYRRNPFAKEDGNEKSESISFCCCPVFVASLFVTSSFDSVPKLSRIALAFAKRRSASSDAALPSPVAPSLTDADALLLPQSCRCTV
mmetsp:Transcript_37629/g.79338  ORF Transcript_37629/g.79338 Transcript_37629/m.79338 type:complete len:209 (-) Transcript_37629:704-1330(-)